MDGLAIQSFQTRGKSNQKVIMADQVMDKWISLFSFPLVFLFVRLFLALCFLVLFFRLSRNAAKRLLKTNSLSVHLTATYVIFSWSLAVLFHLFINFGWFKPIPVAMAFLSMLALALTSGWLKPVPYHLGIPVWIRNLPLLFIIILFVPATLFILLLVARSLGLPLLGWDALTYHGLKAGLWVQQGNYFYDLNPPGGWEYYRTFFGGGELYTAWAMFLTGTSHFAALADGWHVAGLGLASYSIARLIGSDRTLALLLTLIVLTCGTVTDYIGAGYVDIAHTAMLLSGFLFIVLYMRDNKPAQLLLAFAALGLALSIKITALVFIGSTGLVWLVWLFLNRKKIVLTNSIRLLAVLIFLIPVVPWFIYNTLNSGYPLGCVPVKFGSIVLGQMPPNLSWFFERPDLQPFLWKTEWQALRQALNRPLLLLPLFTISIFRIRKKSLKGWQSLLTLFAIAGVIIQYASPGFSVIRLEWAGGNDRFLLPAIILGVFSIGHIDLNTKLYKTIFFYGLIAVWIHMVGFYVRFLSSAPILEIQNTLIILVTFLPVLAAVCCKCFKRKCSSMITLIILGFLPLSTVLILRQQDGDVNAFAASTVLRKFPRYWVHAYRALSEEPASRRIAVTAGPQQISHNWFVYPFLGANLENDIAYISPYRHNRTVPHHPDYDYFSNADFKIWYKRLCREDITHVMSLKPGSLELDWMSTHPQQFSPLVGVSHHWGLYRVNDTVCLDYLDEKDIKK
ncbi:hypothetical protein GF407_09225 [candidate division KSB1 bacterium]|nr:hypothetical protein [candidate division KSB1 bacterium]